MHALTLHELRGLKGNESVQNVNKHKQLNSLSLPLRLCPSLFVHSLQRARSIMSGNVSLKPGPPFPPPQVHSEYLMGITGAGEEPRA